MAPPIIIKISKLAKTLITKQGPLCIISDLDLEVRKGEFLSIIGRPGCGKTALLELIGGLTEPTEGEIYVNGDPPDVARKNREFGFIFGSFLFRTAWFSLFGWRTIEENVHLPGEIFKDDEVKRRAQEMIDYIGLTGYEKALPRRSLRETQFYAAIARVLSYDPSILLMDEVATNENMGLELLRIWKETQKTVIFVTHNIPKAVFLSDRIAVMSPRPGKIDRIADVNLSRPRNPDIRRIEEFANLSESLQKELEIKLW